MAPAFPTLHLSWGGLLLPCAGGLLLLAGLLVLIVLLTRNAGSARRPPPGRGSGESERAATFRRKGETFREERGRILGMVESGKISPEEGDRLLDALARETATMACPFCSEEVRVEAVKCRHCGSFLYRGVGRPRQLTKSRDKMIAGVCGGLAEHLGMDVSLLRILATLAILMSGGVAGLILYLVAALILPPPEE